MKSDRTRRTILKRILRVSFMLALTVVLLELALWIAHWTLGDVEFLHTGTGQGPSILCVGDSHTYGWRVHREFQAYPAHLGLRLREGGGTWTVHNSGVPSRNSNQVLASLPDLMEETQPDYVFVMVGINNSWNLETTSMFRRFRTWSRVYKLVRLLSQKDESSAPKITREGDSLVLEENGERSDLAQQVGNEGARVSDFLRDLTHRELEQIVDLIQDFGAKPLLMTYATDATDAFRVVNDVIREVAENHKTGFVDHEKHLKPFRDASYATVIFEADQHPTGYGYKLMVDGLLSEMKNLGWIQEIPPEIASNSVSSEDPVSVELTIESTQDQLIAHVYAKAGLFFQVLVSDEIQGETTPMQLSRDSDLCKEYWSTGQFSGIIPIDGHIEIRFPKTAALLNEGEPLFIQAAVLDTTSIRGISKVVPIDPK